MKTTIIFLSIIAVIMGLSMTPAGNNNQSIVQKVNGIPVYIMCEPLDSYKVVDYFSTDRMVVVSVPNIDKQVEYYVHRAIKSKIAFDAILYSSGKKCFAIKFK